MAEQIARLGSLYHEFKRAHPTVEEDFAEAIESLLTDAGVNFDQVSVRLKQWTSLKQKARKTRADGTLTYPDPWEDINDIIGVRATTFHSTQIPGALEVLRSSFEVVRSVDKTAETRVAGGFGYGSHHLVLRVSSGDEELEAYRGMRFEVQVRTVLQHAWAEFEHDIRYKRGSLPIDPRVDRAFTLAAGLIELADQQFDQIAALEDPQPEARQDVEFTAATLPGILTVLLGNRFPSSRSQNYRWLERMLHANGLTTVAELEQLLDDEAIEQLHLKLVYQFPPSHIRLIDDLLLLRFGAQHIERTGDKRRNPRLQRRLSRLN